MEEHWKDIQGYEGLYSVSDTGLVKTHIYNKILKPIIQLGYESVVLYRIKKSKAFKVHRLVAMTFLDNPNNYEQVNHIDGNKRNNNVSNLGGIGNGIQKEFERIYTKTTGKKMYGGFKD